MPGGRWALLLTAVGVALLGIALYGALAVAPRERARFIEGWRSQLEAMADDRRAAVDLWLSGGVADARVVAGYPTVVFLTSGETARPREPGIGPRGHLDELLAEFIGVRGYQAATVIDSGLAVIGAAPVDRANDPPCAALARRCLESGTAVVGAHRRGGTTEVAFAAPVFADRARTEAIGAVVVSADPRLWLYPFLAHRSDVSRTGETVLAERDGNDAVLISPLRHRPDPPLTVRRPLSVPGFAGAAALDGVETFARYVDYRGKSVFAAPRALRNAPWGLVVKIDEAEVLESFHRWLTGAAALLLAVAGAFAGVTYGLWRREGDRRELALARGEAHLARLLDLANDAVLYVSRDGMILEANRRAEEMYGYRGEELRGLAIAQLGRPDERKDVPHLLDAVAAAGRSKLETEQVRKDGTTFPVEISSSYLGGGRDGRFLAIVRDIGEQRRAAEALSESEQRYRSLFEQSPIGIYRTTPEGRILLVNRAILEMLGYASTAELVARNLEEEGFQPDYPRGRFKEILARDGEVRGLESSWTTKDGRRLLVIENARAVRAADGTILHFEGTVEDITARKHAEEQALTDRARFRTLTESAPFGMRLSNAAGAITYVNPAWVALFGFTLDDTPTLGAWRELAFPDPEQRAEVTRLWEADRPARERGETISRAMRVTCKDGSRRLVQFTSTTLEGGNALTTCEDMTETAAAQEGQRRLATAIEQAAEGMLITDPNGTIEYVNPAFERITGYTREEAVGQNPRILKSGRQDEAFYADLWRTITAGVTWHGRFVNRRKDGGLYEEDATITPIRDERDHIVSFVAIKRDVTLEVRLQQQLNQAQKMEAVGRLSGGIAHDFNNLLQAMLSQVGVLGQTAAPARGEERHLQALEELIRRGAALTRQLLLFSRQDTPVREPVDVNDLVRGAATMLRRIVRENVVLTSELADDRLLVSADRGQLDQVLMNLVINASDAMPAGGRATLRSGGDATSVWLSVTDSGGGIPDAVRAHLFEPFFTTKPVGKGTGLGLSVVHGIALAHGGRVDVDARTGAGATFTVTLPRIGAEEAETAAEVPEAGERPQGGSERILIVEDEEGAREGLAEILVALGYQVVAKASAEDALALPTSPAFDLVLSDLLLPGMSGIEMVASLERQWPAMRIVLMSGYNEDQAVRASVTGGDLRFLQKPFDLRTLAAAIRGALDELGPGAAG